MILHTFDNVIPGEFAAALAAFEQGFTYPLGPGRTFRISHGDDYARFFRAQGSARVLVAECDGRVVGCLAVVLRWLQAPTGEDLQVGYVADLKIAPQARAGFVLRRLMTAAGDYLGSLEAAFGVVMEGTRVTPETYTGRVGIPALTALGRVAVLRLPTAPAPSRAPGAACEGEAMFRRLSRSHSRFAVMGGRPELRSEMPPLWLVDPDGDACGLLEDTRRAKRLIADDGSELVSAHLSSFAAAKAGAGAELIRAACGEAHRRGRPALFVAVPEADAMPLCEILQMPDVVIAPAVIYGAGLDAGEWNVNTAEI